VSRPVLDSTSERAPWARCAVKDVTTRGARAHAAWTCPVASPSPYSPLFARSLARFPSQNPGRSVRRRRRCIRARARPTCCCPTEDRARRSFRPRSISSRTQANTRTPPAGGNQAGCPCWCWLGHDCSRSAAEFSCAPATTGGAHCYVCNSRRLLMTTGHWISGARDHQQELVDHQWRCMLHA
jgi:hypothetical protein